VQVFDNLYDSAKRCMRREGPEHDLGAKVASDLVNVKAITNHFNPKLKLWSDSHEGAALTPEQVLAIVKKNYESLTLKLQVGCWLDCLLACLLLFCWPLAWWLCVHATVF